MSILKKENIPYLVFIFCIIYQQVALYLGYDSAGRIMFAVLLLSYFYWFKSDSLFRSIVKNKLNVIWLILVVYHYINAICQQVPNTNFEIFFSIITPYFFMVLSCYLYLKNESKALKCISYALLIFIILAFRRTILLNGYDLPANRHWEGMNANQLAQSAGFCLMSLCIWSYCSNMKKFKLLLFATIPTIIVFLCGSRNGLLILILSYGSYFLAPYISAKISPFQFIQLFLIGIVFYCVIDYILNNTLVGERMMSTQDEYTELEYKTGTILDYLGGRSIFYYMGFKNFLEHPFFGIGLWNFRYYNNYLNPLHSEYMVHLTEGGFVGAFLYFTFLTKLVKDVWRNFSTSRNVIGFLVFVSVVTYLLVGLTARCFFYLQFYPALGIAVASSIKYKNYETEKGSLFN